MNSGKHAKFLSTQLLL